MANYYSDHPEIGFYLNHPLMARIVELKEKGFADAKEYDYAPVDLGDAIENYKIFSFCNNQLKTGIAYALLTVTCSINYILSRKIENNKE